MSTRVGRAAVLIAGLATVLGMPVTAAARPIAGDGRMYPVAAESTAVAGDWTPPSCEAGPTLSPFDPGTQWDRIVLDPASHLEKGWKPDDLVQLPALGRHTDGHVRAIILDDLVAMHDAAITADAPFDVVSGFRSSAHQNSIYAHNLATQPPRPDGTPDSAAGPPMVARPGHSEHQLGTTIDIVDPSEISLTSAVAQSSAGRWLAGHAVEYGFVFSYPESGAGTTCYGWEPWHLRWVGVDRAAVIDASGFTPREFMLREADGQLP